MKRAFLLLPLLMLVGQYSSFVSAVPTPVEPIADSDKFLAANAIVPEAAPETMMVADSDGDVLVSHQPALSQQRISRFRSEGLINLGGTTRSTLRRQGSCGVHERI